MKNGARETNRCSMLCNSCPNKQHIEDFRGIVETAPVDKLITRVPGFPGLFPCKILRCRYGG